MWNQITPQNPVLLPQQHAFFNKNSANQNIRTSSACTVPQRPSPLRQVKSATNTSFNNYKQKLIYNSFLPQPQQDFTQTLYVSGTGNQFRKNETLDQIHQQQNNNQQGPQNFKNQFGAMTRDQTNPRLNANKNNSKLSTFNRRDSDMVDTVALGDRSPGTGQNINNNNNNGDTNQIQAFSNMLAGNMPNCITVDSTKQQHGKTQPTRVQQQIRPGVIMIGNPVAPMIQYGNFSSANVQKQETVVSGHISPKNNNSKKNSGKAGDNEVPFCNTDISKQIHVNRGDQSTPNTNTGIDQNDDSDGETFYKARLSADNSSCAQKSTIKSDGQKKNSRSKSLIKFGKQKKVEVTPFMLRQKLKERVEFFAQQPHMDQVLTKLWQLVPLLVNQEQSAQIRNGRRSPQNNQNQTSMNQSQIASIVIYDMRILHLLLAMVTLCLYFDIQDLDKQFLNLENLQSPVTFGQFKICALSLIGSKLMEFSTEDIAIIFRNAQRQIFVREIMRVNADNSAGGEETKKSNSWLMKARKWSISKTESSPKSNLKSSDLGLSPGQNQKLDANLQRKGNMQMISRVRTIKELIPVALQPAQVNHILGYFPLVDFKIPVPFNEQKQQKQRAAEKAVELKNTILKSKSLYPDQAFIPIHSPIKNFQSSATKQQILIKNQRAQHKYQTDTVMYHMEHHDQNGQPYQQQNFEDQQIYSFRRQSHTMTSAHQNNLNHGQNEFDPQSSSILSPNCQTALQNKQYKQKNLKLRATYRSTLKNSNQNRTRTPLPQRRIQMHLVQPQMSPPQLGILKNTLPSSPHYQVLGIGQQKSLNVNGVTNPDSHSKIGIKYEKIQRPGDEVTRNVKRQIIITQDFAANNNDIQFMSPNAPPDTCSRYEGNQYDSQKHLSLFPQSMLMGFNDHQKSLSIQGRDSPMRLYPRDSSKQMQLSGTRNSPTK